MSKGDPRFHKLLREIGELHDKKQEDYGRGSDPFANVRQSSEWGLAPWIGAMVRAGDKFKRLQKAARGGTMANESVEDSMMDLAVYSLIALVLYREENEGDSAGDGGKAGHPAGSYAAVQADDYRKGNQDWPDYNEHWSGWER